MESEHMLTGGSNRIINEITGGSNRKAQEVTGGSNRIVQEVNNMDDIRSNAASKMKANLNNQQIDKVPYIRGEKTVLCWNCQSILMVKEEWNVIQCTNCQKINRIPGTEKKEPVQLNDNYNHFDLYLPYVVSKFNLCLI